MGLGDHILVNILRTFFQRGLGVHGEIIGKAGGGRAGKGDGCLGKSVGESLSRRTSGVECA